MARARGAGVAVALPDRGHDIAVAPDGATAVVFGRRPGFFAAVIDLEDGALRHPWRARRAGISTATVPFAADGTLLFATENAYETGEGRIALYDTTDGFRRIADWPSHGIGPHDLALSRDGRALVAANGGVRTHPDRDREKLNLPHHGALGRPDRRDRRRPAGRGAAARGLAPVVHPPRLGRARRPDRRGPAVGRRPLEPVPLVATWDGTDEMAFCDEFAPANLALAGYTGAICFDPLARSSPPPRPRATAPACGAATTCRLSRAWPIPEVCGLCPGREDGHRHPVLRPRRPVDGRIRAGTMHGARPGAHDTPAVGQPPAASLRRVTPCKSCGCSRLQQSPELPLRKNPISPPFQGVRANWFCSAKQVHRPGSELIKYQIKQL